MAKLFIPRNTYISGLMLIMLPLLNACNNEPMQDTAKHSGILQEGKIALLDKKSQILPEKQLSNSNSFSGMVGLWGSTDQSNSIPPIASLDKAQSQTPSRSTSKKMPINQLDTSGYSRPTSSRVGDNVGLRPGDMVGK